MSRNRSYKKPSGSRKKIEDLQPILMKASNAHREGRLGEAEKGYLKVLKRKPGWGQVLNALGTVYLDRAKLDKAIKTFEKASRLKPPNLSACYNLARIKQGENDHAGAVTIYKKILKEQPDYGEVWNNIALAYKEIGDHDKVIDCLLKAVKYAPEMAEAWNNLGVAQDELGQAKESTKSYQRAIDIRPDYMSAHFNLGTSLHKLKKYPEAIIHFQKVLETEPDHESARFMLQSIGALSDTAPAAPAEHVRRIFDQCAESFEKVLVEELDYRTPELLFKLLRPYISSESNVLDLGCGTGLGASFYKPYSKKLTGVDVSPKMLKKAATKGIYDKLEEFDILQEWPFSNKFDLIYSSDVFVYLGKLEKIMGTISSNLLPTGILAFSVESLDDETENYQLSPSGRYAHSQTYIETCLDNHGLEPLEIASCNLRKESGNQVVGTLVVARMKEVNNESN